MPIGVALIGAGVFAKREHLPAIKGCPLLILKAVHSRSQESAEKFVAEAGEGVDAYYESPSAPSKSLDEMLRRDDIAAVIIVVAISALPDLIKRALAAGKHVLSEKPIAPDVKMAQNLIEYHEKEARGVLWGVAENFRFWGSVDKAAQIIKGLNANLVTFSVTAYSFTDAKNPFYHSEWRKKPTYQGGYLLDGGVHFVAVLRTLLAAVGQKINAVSAYTMSLQADLPPVDTVHALLRTDNGRSGSFISSVGIEGKLAMEFELVTDKGSVTYRPFQKQLLTKLKECNWEEQSEEAPLTWGVKEEVLAFAEGISKGSLDSKLSTSEALNDLKILEAMLHSGEVGGIPIYI